LLSRPDVPRAIVIGVPAGARSAVELAIRHPDMVAGLILIVPGTYSPASPVSIEPSRGNRSAFWAVDAGGNFAWWAAEKIAPSMLIRAGIFWLDANRRPASRLAAFSPLQIRPCRPVPQRQQSQNQRPAAMEEIKRDGSSKSVHSRA